MIFDPIWDFERSTPGRIQAAAVISGQTEYVFSTLAPKEYCGQNGKEIALRPAGRRALPWRRTPQYAIAG
jgi:hypothetical protein